MSSQDETRLINASRPTSLFALLLGVVSIGLLVAGLVASNPHLAILALLPLGQAVVFWKFRPPEIVIEISETGISVDRSDREIPYANIEAVYIGGKPRDPDDTGLKAGHITVTHRGGTVNIPAKLNTSTVDLYRYLLAKVPESGSRQPHPALAEYFQEEIETFGEDMVHSFQPKSTLRRRRVNPRTTACVVMLILTGIAWVSADMVFGLAKGGDVGWVGVGLLLTIGGIVVLIALRSSSSSETSQIINRNECSLIISPKGMAMIQGDLQGQLRWDEIHNVVLMNKATFFHLHKKNVLGLAITIHVAGAIIHVADVYDRPLANIHTLIRNNWRPAELSPPS